MMIPFRGTYPTLDPSVYVAPGAQLVGDITIGEESSVWFNAVIRGDNEPIVIGKRSNIQEGCVLHVDEGAPMSIGDDVTVGHNVILHGCTIGSGSLIGMGAIILNHVRVGEDVLIAAGTLIPERKEIPPRTLVMGNPGRVVRELTERDLQRMRISALHCVQKSREYMTAGVKE